MKQNLDNEGERVLSTGEFPPASKPEEVAKAVYAVFRHATESRRRWDAAMDINRAFYNGDQIKVRRNSPNIVDNQIEVAVGTVKPRVLRSIRDIEVKAASGGDIDAADILSLRVEYGCKASYLEDYVLPECVENMLIEGGAVLKAEKGVMVVSVDPKTVFWTPETGFDDAWYIGQHHLMTLGEAKAMFGKAANKLFASTTELENRMNESNSPPSTTDEAGGTLTVRMAPVGETSPVRTYSNNAFGDSFTKSERLWVIELWVLDRTIGGDGEPVYPCGRLINVAVGASSDGGRNDDELDVMLDRQMPYVKLHENTGRWHIFSYAPYENRRGAWSNSLVTKLLPLQKGLNDVWNTWVKNAKLVNNPRMLAHESLGLKTGSVTNQPGEITEVSSAYNYPANTALSFLAVPSIAQHFVPMRQSFLEAIRDVSGIMDVIRGENPTGVTAGVALGVLDSNANERISSPSRSLSLALAQTKENMAYIAQELDQDPMELPDDSVDTERETVQYDPEASRDISIRIVSVEKLPLEKVATIMGMIGDLEAKGLPGEMVLRYVEDPRLYRLYVEKKKEREQAEQQMLKQQQDMEVDQSVRQIGGDLLKATIGGGDNAVQK